MEKFGIFELLDALAAITETTPPSAEEIVQKTYPQTTEQPPLTETVTETARETATRRVPDAAFSAPNYGNEVASETPPPTGPNALEGFLARHNAVSKKAKK